MAASASSPQPVRLADRPVDLWWPLVLAACAGTAYLTTKTLHGTAALVSLVIVVGLYLRARTAGLAAMWVLWLVSPALRRVFDLAEGYQNADPLAVAPFIATAAIAFFELRRVRLSRRAKTIVGMGLVGFAFGAPAGFFASPAAAAYALLAYCTGVLGFAIGYRERSDSTLSLAGVLAAASIPLSIYGILQAVAPLTPWDAVWLGTVGPDFESIGSKEAGTLRVFGLLNSPGTFAIVLGVTVVCLLAARRFGPGRGVALVVTLAALALTLVRSTWIALALALLLVVVVAPGRIGRRVLLVAALGAIAFPVVVAGNPNVARVGNRASTVSSLGTDTSAQARLNTPQQLFPQAVHQPLGVGLGTAGEASRLGSGSALRATDNALLSLMYQCGPVGFVLVLAAYVLGMVSVVRNVRRRRSLNDVLVFGCMALLTVLLVTGDVFYGITGPIIWYLVGFAVRADEARRLRPVTA